MVPALVVLELTSLASKVTLLEVFVAESVLVVPCDGRNGLPLAAIFYFAFILVSALARTWALDAGLTPSLAIVAACCCGMPLDLATAGLCAAASKSRC